MQIIFHKSNLELITKERVKLAAKITGTDRDEEVTDALNAAIEYVQMHLSIPIPQQTVECVFPFWDGSCQLPFVPTLISSVEANGETLSDDQYKTNYRFVEAAVEGVVKITCTAGFTQETLPTPIKQAILMLATDYLRNQQAQQTTQLYVNEAVDNLLALYRMRMML